MKRPLARTCVISFLALAGALAGTGTVAGEEGGKADAAGTALATAASALVALDLTALFLRRLRREGLAQERGEAALAALWTAAGQVGLNVRPDVALTAAAFEVMAALKK